MRGGRVLSTPGVFTSGRHSYTCFYARKPLALPSSRVTPMDTCPALRPRWCPEHSPWRIPDCCLPATAYRRLSLTTALRIILWTTTLHIAELHHAAYILVPSSFARPLLGVHVDFTSDLLAKLWSGGTCTSHGVHPLGTNNQFHGISPNSKVSGLPWHEQRLVRPRAAPRAWTSTPLDPTALWCAYAASVEGTCFKYARISALTRSISAR